MWARAFAEPWGCLLATMVRRWVGHVLRMAPMSLVRQVLLSLRSRVFAVTELGPIMVVIELSCGIWPIKAFQQTKLTTALNHTAGKVDGLLPMCFAIVPFHLSKVLRLPRKSEAGSYEVLTQNHLSKREDLMLQNATLLRKPVS